ncbi:MAG: phosphoribosylglycinamide formyltransferase [Flavobacteriaceae bacterium]
MKRICVFASGSGTNAENICNYFKNSELIEVVGLVYNKTGAGVVQRMEAFDLPCFYVSNADFASNNFFPLLEELKVDFVVLAGFLRKLSPEFTQKYADRIINIHPALLPKYGGKGMYGQFVHQAVKDANEKETGISIHLVNENYDQGALLFQASTALDASDEPDQIAKKVHALEYKYFPKVIEDYILSHG